MPYADNSRHPNDLVSYIIKELRAPARRKQDRSTLVFYRVVLAGNVNLVKLVLEHLQSKHSYDTLAWTVGRDESKRVGVGKLRASKRLGHLILHLLWSLLFLVLSPVFYVLHALLNNFYWMLNPSMSGCVDLPLIFALMSEKKEMVDLFLHYGASLDSCDSKGNTLFHYLAYKSTQNTDKVIRCTRQLCVEISDVNRTKELLMKKTNHSGLSALEVVAKLGSLKYLMYLLEDSGFLAIKTLVIDEDTCTIKLGSSSSFSHGAVVESDERIHNLEVKRFSLESYDHRDGFGKQSYLLQLFASRNIQSLDEDETRVIQDSHVMKNWMDTKIRQYTPFSIFGNALCFITLVLLIALIYIYRNGGQRFPYANMFMDIFCESVHELFGTASSTSPSILLEQAFNKTADTFLNRCHHVLPNINHDDMVALYQWESFSMSNQSIMETFVKRLLDLLFFLQLTSDILFRQVFLWHNYDHGSRSLWSGAVRVLHKKVAGSYTEKQLLVASSVLYMAIFIIQQQQDTFISSVMQQVNTSIDLSENSSSETNQFIMETFQEVKGSIAAFTDLEDTLNVLFMLCVLMRLLQFVHIFRLFPVTGFFVISTKKMVKHLMQFGAIFVIVICGFAIIFYFIMSHPECPLYKVESHETFSTSLFTTYIVGLGQGDHDYTTDLGAKLAYLACSLIIILVLLNLIIAIMTTTATNLSHAPWCQVLCQVEVWGEILGTEAQVLAMSNIFCGVWDHVLDTTHSGTRSSSVEVMKIKDKDDKPEIIVYN